MTLADIFWNMLKRLSGSVRHISFLSCRKLSSTSATRNETVAANYDQARPYKEIPQVPFLSMIKDPSAHLKFGETMDGLFTSLGPIFRIWIPGKGDRVFIKDPKDIQTVLKRDGKYPIQPGFDIWIHYRYVS